jgi:hypothetical protein
MVASITNTAGYIKFNISDVIGKQKNTMCFQESVQSREGFSDCCIKGIHGHNR